MTEPKTRRVRRSTTTGTERMRKTRATLQDRGLTRLDVTILQATLAEIDRRADERRTSRGEIIAQAIEATRENDMSTIQAAEQTVIDMMSKCSLNK